MYSLYLILVLGTFLKLSLQSGPLKVSPDVTVFEGEGNLTCFASSNLRYIQPYELVWFEQGVGGFDKAIVKGPNATKIVLNHGMLEQHNGQFVCCALRVFNQFYPEHYSTVKTKSIFIKNLDFYNTSLRKHSNKTNDQTSRSLQQEVTDKVVIESVTLVAGLLALIIAGVLLYRKFGKKKRAPPIPEDSLSVERSQDNIYTYVPLQKIPFEEAKNMVTANMQNKLESFKPPPLPARPNHHRSIAEEEEYSYTYGIKN